MFTLAACTPGVTVSVDANVDAPIDTGVSVDYCGWRARYVCTAPARCGCRIGDADACVRNMIAQCRRGDGPSDPAFFACAEQIAHADPCSWRFDQCTSSSPTVPIGGRCDTSLDCVVPARCVATATGYVCAISVAEGGTCTNADQCATGLDCIAGRCAVPTGPCGSTAESCGRNAACLVPQTCQRPFTLGETCRPGWFDCADTLWCDAGVCATRPGVGAPCAGREYCARGARCVTPMGTTTTTYEARVARDGACLGFDCVEGLVCVHGVCGDLPALGEPCSAENLCVADAACNGRCVPRVPLGHSCFGYECAAGLECHWMSYSVRTCVAAPVLGEVCSSSAVGCPCLPDASGVPICQPPRALGDACGERAACPSGSVCRPSAAAACVAELCPRQTL